MADQPGKSESKFDRLEAKIDEIVNRLPIQQDSIGFVHRLAERINRFSFTRLLAALGVWLVLATGIGVYWEYNSRSEERLAREEEAEFRRLAQIATAWEILRTVIGGDIGKGNALNTLISADLPIGNVDLSCKAVGDYLDGICNKRPEYNGVALSSGSFWYDEQPVSVDGPGGFSGPPQQMLLEDVSFAGARMKQLVAEGLILDESFIDVDAHAWRIRGFSSSPRWYLEGGLKDNPLGKFRCSDCEFYNGRLGLDLFRKISGRFASVRVFVGSYTDDRFPIFNWSEFYDAANDLSQLPDGYLETSRKTVSANSAVLPPIASTVGFGRPIHETYLDAPILFLWAATKEVSRETNRIGSLGFETETKLGPALSMEPSLPDTEVVVWSLYEELDYCMNRSDFRDLMRINATAEVDTKEEDGALLQQGLENEFAALPVIVPESVSPEWSRDITAAIKPWHTQGAVTELPPEQDYSCGWSYDFVEPVLRPRVSDYIGSLVWH